MYFYEGPVYVVSTFKTIEHYLLEFTRPYVHYSVSSTWIQQFTAFLKRKQDEFVQIHRRVQPVPIQYEFKSEGVGFARAAIKIGSFYVNLWKINKEENNFDDPPLL